VFVVNALTTPNSVANNDIEINVFISAGDDFEVFVPDDYYQNFVFQEQMGQMDPDSIEAEEPNAPEQLKPGTMLGADSWTIPEMNLVYIGEKITSFRTMLKRYNRHMAVATGTPNCGLIKFQSNMFPYLRGNVAGAVNTRVGPAQYNFCNTVLLHWVTYMFSGWRGSIRYKILPRGVTSNCDIMVSRRSGDTSSGGYSLSIGSAPEIDSSTQAAQLSVYESGDLDRNNSGHQGVAYSISTVNPVMEFEMPFYSNSRFVPGKRENLTNGNENTDYFTAMIYQTQGLQTSTQNPGYFEFWVAAGEDFQVYMYTGLPRMYYEPTVPTEA
jgi:hypothetical protein